MVATVVEVSRKIFQALAVFFSVGRRSQGMARAVLKVSAKSYRQIFLFRYEDGDFSVWVDFQPACTLSSLSLPGRQAENPPKLKNDHLRGEIKKSLSLRFFLNFQNSSTHTLATSSN